MRRVRWARAGKSVTMAEMCAQEPKLDTRWAVNRGGVGGGREGRRATALRWPAAARAGGGRRRARQGKAKKADWIVAREAA